MSDIRLILLLALAVGAAAVPDPLTVHREAMVVDLHADTLLDLAAGKRTLDGVGGGGHIDLPRLRQGGVDVQVFAAFVDPREAARGKERMRELLAAFHRAMDRHADGITAGRTVAEIEAARRAGKIAAVLSVENLGDAVQGDLAHIDVLSREGVRMASLTWNAANALGDGARESRHGGLTPLGRRAIARMQELGMILDVSHLSPAAFWDALAASRGPIIASHSDAAVVQPHRRNLTDDQLRALADRGGVVGINFYPVFLGAPTLERIVAHIEHMVAVMGDGYVGLGSDFDGIEQVPRGLEDISKLPELTRALLQRGYTPERVRKILGENALRVFRQVWGR